MLELKPKDEQSITGSSSSGPARLHSLPIGTRFAADAFFVHFGEQSYGAMTEFDRRFPSAFGPCGFGPPDSFFGMWYYWSVDVLACWLVGVLEDWWLGWLACWKVGGWGSIFRCLFRTFL